MEEGDQQGRIADRLIQISEPISEVFEPLSIFKYRQIALGQIAKLGFKSHGTRCFVVGEEIGRLGPYGVGRGAALHDEAHHAGGRRRVDERAD